MSQNNDATQDEVKPEDIMPEDPRSKDELAREVKKCESELVRAVVLLQFVKPFYGHMLTSTNKRVVVGGATVLGRNIKTAAVYVTELGMHMVIHADFWATLTEAERTALLEHEILHLAFRHCSRGQKYRYAIDRWSTDRWNLAVDLVVNSYVEGLPGTAQLPAAFDLPEKKTAEFYYRSIPDDAFRKLVGLVGGLDDHGLWGQGDVTDVVKEAVVAAAIENAIKAAGSIPGDLQSLLDKITGGPVVPWYHYLRRFLIGTGTKSLNYTKKRISKRYKTRPGIKLKPKSDILLAVDVSGSISDRELQAFFREIDFINRTKLCNLLLLQFDAEVKEGSFQEPYQSSEQIHVHGRGGTQFDPIFQFIVDKQLRVDAVVVLTDGHNFDGDLLAKRNPPMSTLWVITKGGDTDVAFGESVEMDLDIEDE